MLRLKQRGALLHLLPIELHAHADMQQCITLIGAGVSRSHTIRTPCEKNSMYIKSLQGKPFTWIWGEMFQFTELFEEGEIPVSFLLSLGWMLLEGKIPSPPPP